LHESAISSTRIRENLLNGNLQEANELLGYDYFFEGSVVEGNKMGRTLGYPTANLEVYGDEKLVPYNGVYAVWITVKDTGMDMKRWKGMMNIGIRPTINGTARVIEVNLFDFDENIYGKKLRVHLKKYMRGEQKFSSLDALKEQLTRDKVNALEVL
jgi:riboflavin kinase/FMN adenylyltransferase